MKLVKTLTRLFNQITIKWKINPKNKNKMENELIQSKEQEFISIANQMADAIIQMPDYVQNDVINNIIKIVAENRRAQIEHCEITLKTLINLQNVLLGNK